MVQVAAVAPQPDARLADEILRSGQNGAADPAQTFVERDVDAVERAIVPLGMNTAAGFPSSSRTSRSNSSIRRPSP
ncbi:MAG TPA: hypothetical protein VGJ97_07215 [Anaerolineaceae bacterium]